MCILINIYMLEVHLVDIGAVCYDYTAGLLWVVFDVNLKRCKTWTSDESAKV